MARLSKLPCPARLSECVAPHLLHHLLQLLERRWLPTALRRAVPVRVIPRRTALVTLLGLRVPWQRRNQMPASESDHARRIRLISRRRDDGIQTETQHGLPKREHTRLTSLSGFCFPCAACCCCCRSCFCRSCSARLCCSSSLPSNFPTMSTILSNRGAMSFGCFLQKRGISMSAETGAALVCKRGPRRTHRRAQQPATSPSHITHFGSISAHLRAPAGTESGRAPGAKSSRWGGAGRLCAEHRGTPRGSLTARRSR